MRTACDEARQELADLGSEFNMRAERLMVVRKEKAQQQAAALERGAGGDADDTQSELFSEASRSARFPPPLPQHLGNVLCLDVDNPI